ncbi:MAG: hypothetical protein ACM37W_08265 [Actinomycetota bacterium]
MTVGIVGKVWWDYLSVSRLKLGQVLTVGSVFEVIEMGLMVDAIASPVLFEEEEDTGLVELAIKLVQSNCSIQTKQGFYTPLDIIDGMARIYDPIVQGIENPDTPMFGYFLKDYLPYPW